MSQPIFSSIPKRPISMEMTQHISGVQDFVLYSRLVEATQEGFVRYPVFRNLRLAAQGDPNTIFEALGKLTGFRAHRPDGGSLILDHDQALIYGYGRTNSSYVSLGFDIWAENSACAETMIESIEQCIGSKRITDAMFSINWHFLTSKNELESVAIEELANDVLLDEAYPCIEEGLQAFIERYLNSKESILVLQGPPGTGKTRLIRGILGAMSRRKNSNAKSIYTGDGKTLESDGIFVKFITGADDAFVVEDADHMLKPRADGNQHLHRFLTIADGVVRAQGRKIIFSTNLPNMGDLDDALIRPGRCFARVYVRQLSLAETMSLLQRLCEGETERVKAAYQALLVKNRKEFSLAEIYQAANL